MGGVGFASIAPSLRDIVVSNLHVNGGRQHLATEPTSVRIYLKRSGSNHEKKTNDRPAYYIVISSEERSIQNGIDLMNRHESAVFEGGYPGALVDGTGGYFETALLWENWHSGRLGRRIVIEGAGSCL